MLTYSDYVSSCTELFFPAIFSFLTVRNARTSLHRYDRDSYAKRKKLRSFMTRILTFNRTGKEICIVPSDERAVDVSLISHPIAARGIVL